VTSPSRPPRVRPTALLVDLDGVLRRWDTTVVTAAEERHGLPEGSLVLEAMSSARLAPAITGEVPHSEWMAGVADALAATHGEAAHRAVREWQAYRGEVDPDVLAVIRDARAAGVRVGLATNATDVLPADLAALGLADEVDAVLNSAEIGVAKPAPEFFARACAALDTPAERVLLLDDTDRVVRGARAAGLPALRYTGPADLPYVRAALGL
jgi:putative hydrolase of the HAD superfamily